MNYLHSLNPPHDTPILYKGGVDFLKFGNEGGDKIFFLEMEGLDERGGIAWKGGFFTFILNFHKKDKYQNDFQFV